MYTTYVLQSLKNGRLYIGSTNNLSRRLSEHNSGQSTYTKSTRPYVLVYSEEFLTRTEAVRRELALKTGQGRLWLKNNISITVA
ncbi:MAG TPA: GIY-YIG nuclease family protein [Candidatus Woesebacteria bacterium]|nr:GIY-YIG nuclease family protein [Candidatus Woesebacteria bacterium]